MIKFLNRMNVLLFVADTMSSGGSFIVSKDDHCSLCQCECPVLAVWFEKCVKTPSSAFEKMLESKVHSRIHSWRDIESQFQH
jgi:hypothetical protein